MLAQGRVVSWLSGPSESFPSFPSLGKGLKVSQGPEEEHRSRKGLLVGRPAVVRVWGLDGNPAPQKMLAWRVIPQSQMGLNISAVASVGQVVAPRDEMPSPGVTMLPGSLQLENTQGKGGGGETPELFLNLKWLNVPGISKACNFCHQVKLDLERENTNNRLTSLSVPQSFHPAKRGGPHSASS